MDILQVKNKTVLDGSLNKKDGLIISLSFFIPFFVILFLYALLGISPFGDKSLMFADAKYQYISYYGFYIDLFQKGKSLFYSLEKLIGGNISGFYAYYLASPFNLLFLLFDKSHIIPVFDIITALKMSCCGLSLALFFKYGTKRLNWQTLIFTTAYSFCGYNMNYCWCSMWIDAVIMLPIIMLGIQKLFFDGKPYLYVFSLSFSIFCCFYTGYMLCAASVLYFAYLFLLNAELIKGQKSKKIAGFGLSSVCSGGISAVLLVPCMLSYGGGSNGSAVQNIKDYTYPLAIRLLSVFAPFLSQETRDKYVVIALFAFALMIVVIAIIVVYVFLIKNSAKREKWLVGIAVLALFLFFYWVIEIPVQKYTGTNNREILSKSLLGVMPVWWETYEGTPNIYVGLLPVFALSFYFTSKEIESNEKILSVFLLAIFIVSFAFYLPTLAWHGFDKNGSFNYRYSFILSFLILVLAEKGWNERKKNNKTVLYVFVYILAVIIEYLFAEHYSEYYYDEKQIICISSVLLILLILFFLWNQKRNKVYLASIIIINSAVLLASAGQNFSIMNSESLIDSGYKKAFFETNDKIETVLKNDSDFYRIRKEKNVINDSDPMLFGYYGVTNFSSAERAGVIHFLKTIGIDVYSGFWANGEMGQSRTVDSLLGVKYYVGENAYNDYSKSADNIYMNPYCLPLSFQAVDTPSVMSQAETGSMCKNLNCMLSSLSGIEKSIFNPAKAEAEKANEGEIVYSITVASSDPVYAEIPKRFYSQARVLHNGEEISSSSAAHESRLLSIGSFSEGETIKIAFDLVGDELSLPPENEIAFYYESTETLKNITERIKKDSVDINLISDSHIIARTHNSVDDKNVIFTIPFDEGWKVLIDGERATAFPAFGILMGIPVESGTHTVELKYTPPGFRMGMIVSSVSLLALAIFFFMIRGKRNEKKFADKFVPPRQ